MLTKEENDLLCLTGAETPMGKLMRRYWIPALLTSELPKPDCPPVRTTLLGEQLIAFRDTNGKVGLLDVHCAHRGASLFFGRNEECGLRCVYHGWKYDVEGRCVDMPNEPPESTFKDKVRIKAYPCVEQGGAIWAYMGPPELQPEPPALEWSTVPEEQRFHSKRLQECNWLQAMEGGIDSSHISFLHSGVPPLRKDKSDPLGTIAGMGRFPSGEQSQARASGLHQRDTAPRFETIDTDYGLLIGARRDADEEKYYWRITQWLFPWYTMIPPFGGGGIGGHAWVPIDNESCWAWSVSWHPARAYSEEELAGMRRGGGIHSVFIPGTFRPVANKDNDYLIDRERQKYENFTGIEGIGTQDCSVQESMGPMFDRRKERLGASDAAIMAARRRLLAAVRNHEQGIDPPGLDAESQKVRSFSTLLPVGVPFDRGAAEGLVARPGHFLVSV